MRLGRGTHVRFFTAAFLALPLWAFGCGDGEEPAGDVLGDGDTGGAVGDGDGDSSGGLTGDGDGDGDGVGGTTGDGDGDGTGGITGDGDGDGDCEPDWPIPMGGWGGGEAGSCSFGTYEFLGPDQALPVDCDVAPSACRDSGDLTCGSNDGFGGMGGALVDGSEELSFLDVGSCEVSECVRVEGDLPGKDDIPIEDGVRLDGHNYYFTAPIDGVYVITVDASSHRAPSACGAGTCELDGTYLDLSVGTACGNRTVFEGTMPGGQCLAQLHICLDGGTTYYVQHPSDIEGYDHTYTLTIELPK